MKCSELRNSRMKHSNALAICLSWILLGIVGESAAFDALRRTNDVGVDFHSHTLGINTTNNILSPVDQPRDQPATWIWKPVGQQRNSVPFEAIIRLFKELSGSGEEELGSGNDDDEDEEPKDNKTTREQMWTFRSSEASTETTTTQSPKTFDIKRNKTEEKMHFIYQSHLRMTNWCFKDNEETKTNHRFKVKLFSILFFITLMKHIFHLHLHAVRL